jgi:hypothetical protein
MKKSSSACPVPRKQDFGLPVVHQVVECGWEGDDTFEGQAKTTGQKYRFGYSFPKGTGFVR